MNRDNIVLKLAKLIAEIQYYLDDPSDYDMWCIANNELYLYISEVQYE